MMLLVSFLAIMEYLNLFLRIFFTIKFALSSPLNPPPPPPHYDIEIPLNSA